MYVVVLGGGDKRSYVGWSDINSRWTPVSLLDNAYFFKDYITAFGVATSVYGGPENAAVAQVTLKEVNVDEMTKKMQEQILQMNQIVRGED